MEARQKRLKMFATVKIILEQPSHGRAQRTPRNIEESFKIVIVNRK
jgi:hypothetical protein